jgi:MoaA/NifB/PqqE/SkfB family radical SAM enzyme
VSIRNKVLPYILKAMRGDVRLGQLADFARNRLVRKAEIMTGPPTHISVLVTSRCCFRCDMCPTHSTKTPESYVHRHREAPDMSVDLLRSVLDRYPNVVRVPLIGLGEPLLNPQLFDLVTECTKRRMIADTISNGYTLDAFIPDIVSSDIDRICVSINGHTADEFHRMTGNPGVDYSRILRNVEALVRRRANKRSSLRIDLSFIIDSTNYLHMKDMIEVAEGLRVDDVYLAQFIPSPHPGFTPQERCLFSDDQEVVEELALLMSKKYRCHVRWPYLLRRPGGERTICRWPFSMIRVDGTGNVGGCPMALHNMRENGTIYDRDPWNNQYFRDLRSRHLKGPLFWPCQFCVESAGVEPGYVFKGKLPIKFSENGGTDSVPFREKEL